MDNQPSFDRSLIIPIVLGGFSIIGIIVVLLVGRSLSSPADVPVTPSATPFQYLYLGTEPAITTPLIEGSELPPLTDEPVDELPDEPIDEPTEESTGPNLGFDTPAPPSVSTPLVFATNSPRNTNLRTNTPTGQPTSTIDSTAVAAHIYDDTDSLLNYLGDWVSQTEVTGTHQGTLHISRGVGDSVTFPFIGSEIHLFYQAGPSLGTITIQIDEADQLNGLPLSQYQDNTQIEEWVSDTLANREHSIEIVHSGGGSVNIDSLIVTVPTPTPTRTPTSTQ